MQAAPQPEPRVYLNGAFVAASEARVSVFDRGFLYGDGVFETVRAYGGTVFEARAHYARLARGLEVLGIPVPFSLAGFRRILAGCLAENGLTDAVLRLSVTRGEGPPAPAPTGNEAPTVAALPRPFTPPEAGAWARGLSAVTSPVRATPPEVLDPAVKGLSFLSHVLALRDARARGADEALLLNARGEVAEGSVSNLFGVWDGVLVTPPVSAGALPGVTRQVVLELAREAGIPAREEPIPETRLTDAEELMVTNSVWEVMPLARLDGAAAGGPGPVTRRLADLFRERVLAAVGAAVGESV